MTNKERYKKAFCPLMNSQNRVLETGVYKMHRLKYFLRLILGERIV